jgi:hypothetical protein
MMMIITQLLIIQGKMFFFLDFSHERDLQTHPNALYVYHRHYILPPPPHSAFPSSHKEAAHTYLLAHRYTHSSSLSEPNLII